MLDNTAVNDDIIENLSDEQDDTYSNDDLYNINSWGLIYLSVN